MDLFRSRLVWAARLLFVSLLVAPVAHAEAPVTLQGAGATFPAPLYQRWFQEFTDASGHPHQLPAGR
jgi:ABC-type phosphate transport system substrate-binding protein